MEATNHHKSRFCDMHLRKDTDAPKFSFEAW